MGGLEMIYRRGKSPKGTKFSVYQCPNPECGFETEIAGFLRKNVFVRCACGEFMVRAFAGEDRKSHLQLVLQLEERREGHDVHQ